MTVWVFTWSSWPMCSWVYPCRLSLSLIQSNHPLRRPQNWPPLDSPMTIRVGLDLQAVSGALGHLVHTWWACCHGDESLAVILGMTFLQPFSSSYWLFGVCFYHHVQSFGTSNQTFFSFSLYNQQTHVAAVELTTSSLDHLFISTPCTLSAHYLYSPVT